MDYDDDGELDFEDEEWEDPLAPKPTCFTCSGLGVVVRPDGRESMCWACGGTGAQR